jgi:hypothetical protein
VITNIGDRGDEEDWNIEHHSNEIKEEIEIILAIDWGPNEVTIVIEGEKTSIQFFAMFGTEWKKYATGMTK